MYAVVEHRGRDTRYLVSGTQLTTSRHRDRAVMFAARGPAEDAARALATKGAVECTSAAVAELVPRMGIRFWHEVATFDRAGAS